MRKPPSNTLPIMPC